MSEPLAPSDAALWRSVERTLIDTLLPTIDDPWARTAAIQLAGLAADASARFAASAHLGNHPGEGLLERDEALIHSYRGGIAPRTDDRQQAPAPGSPDWVAALERWLVEHRISTSVAGVQRIATGNSRAMWRVAQSSGPALVLRIEQGGVFGSDGTVEATRMSELAALGLPVAPVLGIEPSSDVLGHPFFVMAFVDSVPSAGEDRSLPASVAADYVRRLHDLHQVAAPSTWGPADATAACLAQIARWESLHHASVVEPLPHLEAGAAWLRRHLAVSGPASVVHGDPGPGNFLHDGTRLLVFTDWEFVHGGAPAEDWAFLIRMRGSRTMSEANWRQLIADQTGVVLDDDTLRYWTVFNFFKGACANLTCLSAFEGPNPAPNMAIIGTALQRRFQNAMTSLMT